jgi:hypothetical protein
MEPSDASTLVTLGILDHFRHFYPLDLIWGLETTSDEIYLTHPVLFPISIGSEVHLIFDVALYFEMGINFEPLYSTLCAAASVRGTFMSRSSPYY